MSPRYYKATLLYQQGRFLEAEVELREALAEGAGTSHVHALLGLCLVRANLPQEARQELQTALTLNPNDAYGYYAMSFLDVAAMARTDFSERRRVVKPLAGTGSFLQSITTALELEPDNVTYLLRKGSILQMLGKWRESLEPIREALRHEPAHCEAAINLAEALIRLRQPREAREVLYRSLENNPAESLAHAGMGWALLRVGDYQRAEQFFNEALRLHADLEWAQSGALECAKHGYRIHRWIAGLKRWFEMQNRFIAVLAGLGLAMCAFGFFSAYFLWADPVLRRWAGNQGFAAFTLAWLMGVGLLFFFHNEIFLWLVRRERAANTAVGTRSRRFAGRMTLLVVGGALLVPVNLVVSHFWEAGPTVLASLLPGMFGLYLAFKTFPAGKRRRFWVVYVILLLAATPMAILELAHYTEETPKPAGTVAAAFLPLLPLIFIADAEDKKARKQKHFDAVKAAKQSREKQI